MCREKESLKLEPLHIYADYLEGLIDVVPPYGAGDDVCQVLH